MHSNHPYSELTPDTLLDAVESAGFHPTGSLLALNSYENRVYQIGLDGGEFVIGKFYRPGRWSDAAILEEHRFAWELARQEIPIVAPLADANDETLHTFGNFRFALFPRRGGHWPELEDAETRLRIGRFLGRIHAVGRSGRFAHRPTIGLEMATEAVDYLLQQGFVPSEYRDQYRQLAQSLIGLIEQGLGRFSDIEELRLHGDCHPGNILWTDHGAHFVDLDDCRTGPAIQDLWMLLSGDDAQMRDQLADVVAGYEEFSDFDWREVHLIEPLRGLRMLHYSGWLARRWDDPAFPQAFPWFNTPNYWEEQILSLREQIWRMQEAVEVDGNC